MNSFAIGCLVASGCSVVFHTIDSCSVVEVDDDLLVGDFLGGQIVGDLRMTSLLMVHDVVEVVGLCYDHFFFLLAIEIGIDHGIGEHEMTVVWVFVPICA